MSQFLLKTICITICPRCWSKRLLIPDKQCTRFSSYFSSAAHSAHDEYTSSTYSDTSSSSSDTSSSSSDTSSSSSDSELDTRQDDQLYPHHIPTTPLQKVLLSVGAATMAITKPWRGDMVATFGETSGQLALVRMRRKMLEDPTGRLILQEKPRITTDTVDLAGLRSLPEGTLGKAYVNWLDTNRASPDERAPVHFVDDPDLAYVMQRYRDTHDLFHAVLGMPTNMLGEIVVKWVEAIQLGLPMCALGAVFGPIRLGPKHRQLYLQTHLWWALRNGRHAKFLLNVYYENHWDWPLDQLRKELNLEPPPDTPERKHF